MLLVVFFFLVHGKATSEFKTKKQEKEKIAWRATDLIRQLVILASEYVKTQVNKMNPRLKQDP